MGLPSSVLVGPLLLTLFLVLSCPSQSVAYIEKILENGNVCSMNFVSNLYLEGYKDQSALVVKGSDYLKKWTGLHDFNCQFVVSPPPLSGFGLFAVIQHMSLRRDEKGNCIDYVKFRQTDKFVSIGDVNFKIKSSGPWSSKICGKVNFIEFDVDGDNYNDISEEDNNKTITNSFINHRGFVEVKIHIAKRSLKPEEDLNLEIVFTSFQDECQFDHGLWKRCGGKTCIYEEFFNDGKLNCPYKCCKDENIIIE